MTLQVVLIGEDGFVLASDEQMTRYEGGARSTSLTEKIFINSAKNVICACAGDNVTEFAADMIMASGLGRDPRTTLKETGAEAWKLRFGENKPPVDEVKQLRTVIVATSDSQVWALSISSTSSVWQIKDKFVTGDPANSARFFVEHYFPEERTGVDRLLLLAAHVICMGHVDNPRSIKGLRMIACRDGVFTVFREEEIEKLKEESKRLHDRIREGLFRS